VNNTAKFIFRSIQDPMSEQASWSESICGELEEIRRRFAVVQTAMKGKKAIVEGTITGRAHR
jgi:hypothetical protein